MNAAIVDVAVIGREGIKAAVEVDDVQSVVSADSAIKGDQEREAPVPSVDRDSIISR